MAWTVHPPRPKIQYCFKFNTKTLMRKLVFSLSLAVSIPTSLPTFLDRNAEMLDFKLNFNIMGGSNE